jgi:hypothetical protein
VGISKNKDVGGGRSPQEGVETSTALESSEKLLWHSGNSMVRTSRTIEERCGGCSKRPSSKATASEEAKACVSVR